MSIESPNFTSVDRNDEEYNVPWSNRETWLGVSFLIIWLLMMTLFAFFFPNQNMTLFLAIGEAFLVLPVWWFGVRHKSWAVVGIKKFSLAAFGIGCGLMIGSWLINLAYSLILTLFELQIQPDLTALFSELSSPGWVIVIGVFLAPLAEELFFRGFIFAGFRQKYGWKKAALMSALLFAFIHMQPTAILPIFILGIIFAILYHYSASIWPAVLMHMLSNGLALGAVYLVTYMEKFDLISF